MELASLRRAWAVSIAWFAFYVIAFVIVWPLLTGWITGRDLLGVVREPGAWAVAVAVSIAVTTAQRVPLLRAERTRAREHTAREREFALRQPPPPPG